MCNPNAEFRANQRRSNSRINISVDQHHVRPVCESDGLESAHDRGSLLSMRSRTNIQVFIGFRDSELLEEHIRHLHVIMLTCVDESLNMPMTGEPTMYRCSFHEVRTGADHMEHVHPQLPFLAPAAFRAARTWSRNSSVLTSILAPLEHARASAMVASVLL